MPPPSFITQDIDDEAFVPLLNQPYLSNPLNHRRITFVPAAPAISVATSQLAESSATSSAADRYFAIVFNSAKETSESETDAPQRTHVPASDTGTSLCPACHLPLPSSPSTLTSYPHECLLAHQSSLPHSHPPSHLPRSNKGLQYLSSYGWDPDSGQGLGTNGEGIRDPIKPSMKSNTSGLGVKVNKDRKEEPKKQMLDARKIRKLGREDKRKKEKLQREFWGRNEVEKYLGPG